MKKYLKTSNNFYNNRNIPLIRKSPSTLKTEPSNYNHEIVRKDINYFSGNKDINNIYSKALSKKKRRGVFDMSSPGNKDVLTDTDSEIPENSKNMELINKNMRKKNGCAKLIIDKIESQEPQNNEEYYKFTNQKRYNNINGNKYKYNNRLKIKSPINGTNINSFNNMKFNNIGNTPNNNKSPYLRNNNDKGFKSYKQGKIMDKSYINFGNGNLVTTYKNNIYNKILSTNPSSKEKNNYIKDSGNSYFDHKNKSYFQKYKSPFLHKSTESSVDKGSTSYFMNNNNNNIKRNIYIENDFSTPTFSNIDDSYPNKRTMALKKNLEPNTKHQKTISLYNNYKDLIKRPTINQLINLNNSKSNKPYLQNIFNEKLIKNIIKIQSFWRGAFIRELMTFVGKLNNFINTLNKIFQTHKINNLNYFFNLLKNIKRPPRNKKISVGLKGPSMRHKYIFSKEKNDRTQISKNIEKNKNHEIKDNNQDNKYNNLLKNYNSLMDKYNKLKEEVNQIKNKKNVFDNLDIDKNNIEIIDKKASNKLSEEIENNKEEKANDDRIDKNEEIKKKFEIILQEKKEEFNIIPKNDSNFKLRGKNPNKKLSYQIEKISQINFKNETNKNDEAKEISYEIYLNHFKLNINVDKNERFIIDETSNLSKNTPNIIPFDISNNSLTIINKGNKKDIEQKEEKQPKKFENISINKIENGELTIINIKKEKNSIEIKEEQEQKESKDSESKKREEKNKKNDELITESQNNLNIEIKGFEEKKLLLFKDCIIDKNNNKIDIIQNKKPKEFDKEKMSTKNDILLNIISEKNYSDSNKYNIEEKKKEFIIEKNEDILLLEKNKNKNKKSVEILMIDNNNILYIKRKKKIRCDKITEITEELNKIEPHNHYELVFKGKINLNENFENKQEKINEQKIEQKKEENRYKEENKRVNYNKENEVEKGDGIEINPLEFKKTNPNNIIISYENKIEVLYNKNATFTEKAKRNMMKIILPIRLKTVLRGYIRRIICPLIIKRTKMHK